MKKRKKKVFDMGREMKPPSEVVLVPPAPDLGAQEFLDSQFRLVLDPSLRFGTLEIRDPTGTFRARVKNAGLFFPPFAYDENGAFITNSRGERVLDVRAWGSLTGHGDGGAGLSFEEAADIQDEFGKWVVTVLNLAAKGKMR